MKKLLTMAVTTLLISSTAFASMVTSTSTLNTKDFDTKTQAYEAGFILADSLSNKTDFQLQKDLRVLDGSDVSINNVEVKVTELATDPNTISYRAELEVNYSYDSNDS
ncbi:DUF3316 domain-containing protein [Vibrio sp. TH_r3]|uniref:DUF3316 domain-containing protein n=1 Tax=Vibrio sp. TH_r3 TaxID=3082084 RepID=UPI00295457E3|nr:DUF3316 domain-containing protein [Vibrio sp. TH_r3]MDV7106380.1 DUF3316 domain-containing protein [Vibrio sp. TH_r3]